MAGFSISDDDIRRLATLIEETGLTELEVSEGDRRLRLRREVVVQTVAAAPVAAPGDAASVAAAARAAAPVLEDLSKHPGAVTSPMVGTAYMTPEPGAPPYVEVGKTVKQGDILLIIEAMKVYNPIRAPQGGKVVRVLVETGQPVEFEEVLVVIE